MLSENEINKKENAIIYFFDCGQEISKTTRSHRILWYDLLWKDSLNDFLNEKYDKFKKFKTIEISIVL